MNTEWNLGSCLWGTPWKVGRWGSGRNHCAAQLSTYFSTYHRHPYYVREGWPPALRLGPSVLARDVLSPLPMHCPPVPRSSRLTKRLFESQPRWDCFPEALAGLRRAPTSPVWCPRVPDHMVHSGCSPLSTGYAYL